MIDTILSAAVEVATDDRQFAVDRPSRGVHSTAMRRAATVPSRWRAFASCVSERESGGSYTARNTSGSSASGRWQLLDRTWRINGGIHYTVSKRLKAVGVPAGVRAVVRDYLHATPIYRWPAPYQDAAFVQIVSEGGWKHWYLAGSRCNGLVP